jgi:hypothetical protein
MVEVRRFEPGHPLSRRSRPTGRATRFRLWAILVRIQGALRHVVIRDQIPPGLPSLTQLARVPGFYPGSLGSTPMRGTRRRWRNRTARFPSKETVPGSNPGRRAKHKLRWRKRTTHLALNQENAGSTPARSTAHRPWVRGGTFASANRVRVPVGLLRGSQVGKAPGS